MRLAIKTLAASLAVLGWGCAFSAPAPPDQPSEARVDAALREIAREANSHLPLPAQDGVSIDRVEAGPGRVLAYHLVVEAPGPLASQAMARALRDASPEVACSKPETRSFIGLGATLAFVYRSPAGVELARASVGPGDCPR